MELTRLNLYFTKLTEPTEEILEALNRWENDPLLIPLTRPNKNQEELERQWKITLDDLRRRIKNRPTYLIYLNDQLIGEMNYMVDPEHLYKREPGTAWLAITIGEEIGRGRGIGYMAIQYLEEQIRQQGLKRIELGVFEFNKQAQKLYMKLGYRQIARIENFTYLDGEMWADIRMEKYL